MRYPDRAPSHKRSRPLHRLHLQKPGTAHTLRLHVRRVEQAGCGACDSSTGAWASKAIKLPTTGLPHFPDQITVRDHVPDWGQCLQKIFSR